MEVNEDGALVLTYDPEGDGTGTLQVQAAAGNFSGYAMCMIAEHALVDIADGLTTYPLPVGAPVGFDSHTQLVDRGIDPDARVAFWIRLEGVRGQVAIDIHLVDQQLGGRAEVKLTLLTTYARLEAFSAALRALVDRDEKAARVDGDVLA